MAVLSYANVNLYIYLTFCVCARVCVFVRETEQVVQQVGCHGKSNIKFLYKKAQQEFHKTIVGEQFLWRTSLLG